MIDQAVDDGAGQTGDLVQQAVAMRADRRIQRVGREAYGAGANGEVEELFAGEVDEAFESGLDVCVTRFVAEVVPDDELAVVAEATDEFFELEAEEATVAAELDGVVGDLAGDGARSPRRGW